MIVTKKAISRRTVLRGVGRDRRAAAAGRHGSGADGVPEDSRQTRAPAGVVYHPNGVVYENWLPKGTGAGFEFSRVLAPLEPFRDRVVVVTGLADRQAEALGDGGGDHSRASGSYLTGVHVKKSDSMVQNSVSMDQLAAKAFERDTQLSSLQLTVDKNNLVGSCDTGYSCAYSNTLSWLTPTLPLMSENDPRVVFERLFGASDSTDPRVRMARLRQDRSILDSVTDRVKQLQQKLGACGQYESQRLSRVAARRRTAYPEGRASRARASCRMSIVRRHSRRVRRARAAALRPAGARVSSAT